MRISIKAGGGLISYDKLKQKYQVGDSQMTDSLYSNVIKRLHDFDESKLTETGVDNLEKGYNFLKYGSEGYKQLYNSSLDFPKIDENAKRVVPMDDEYLQLLLKNQHKLTDEDISNILNMDFQHMKPSDFVGAATKLYPIAKKLGYGLTDIGKIKSKYTEYFNDPNVTFKLGGKVTQRFKH